MGNASLFASEQHRIPLSASDIQYLNKLLDQHLKAQRTWPWARYLSLLAAVLLAVTGIAIWMQASTLDGFMDDILTTAIHRKEPSATTPVTEAQMLKLMESSEEMLKAYAKFTAMMAALRVSACFMAMLQWYFGATLFTRTIIHWNRPRRDTILITLLREKCAAELTLPSVPRTNS